MQLDEVEARVVGSLVEKELATPQQYPLTLNALVAACNQSSNRDPVLELSDAQVLGALDTLKAEHLVRFVLPSHGRSVVRYRHVLHETLGLEERQRALLAVLLLRGPQTVGELRARTERMVAMPGLEDVEIELRALANRAEPLVARVPRQPGQKEERYRDLATGDLDARASTPAPAPAPAPGPVPQHRSNVAMEATEDGYPTDLLEPGTGGPDAGIGHLADPGGPDRTDRSAWQAEIRSLRSEIAAINQEVDNLKRQLHNLRQELGD